ncbi:MAG TPA: hypothetical protein VG889_06980 [Rhizomicrobium sp.]|nr:hypothetical protein [Rhizomicrobium sp.]
MTETSRDICPASARLNPGRDPGPWYRTLMPFEHFNSIRTQEFPYTCDVRQLAGLGPATVATRDASGTYYAPYNVVTRERDELFVYGGYVNVDDGAYVAKLDATSLNETWRVNLKVAKKDWFEWPGVAGVLGNGFVYAVAGNLLGKIDPASGAIRIKHLPEHRGGFGAAYNGFVVTEGGVLICKSMERGTDAVNGQLGLRAVAKNGIPAFLLAIDPETLEILAEIQTEEPILGRVTVARSGGRDYVYLAGTTHIWRYLYTGDAFVLDTAWNPLYVDTAIGEEPGTACGLLHDWVVVQTNFLFAKAPLRISAFHVEDAGRAHTLVPFPDGAPSQEFSKPAIDPATWRIYTNDQVAGLVGAVDLNPKSGLSLAWKAEQSMASFWAIVGPERDRNIIGTDHTPRGDHVLWRDAKDGRELVRSAVLDPKLNPGIVASGFNGRFYYLAEERSKVVELSLLSR